MDPSPTRRAPEETWRLPEQGGIETPRDLDRRPYIAPVMPAHDDAELGFGSSREGAAEAGDCFDGSDPSANPTDGRREVMGLRDDPGPLPLGG